MLRGASAVMAAGLVVGATTACGSTPVAPTTVAPAEFKVLSDAADGYAIAVPNAWQEMPLNPDLEVFDPATNRIRIANPKLASAIVLARIIAGSGGQMMAVDPEGKVSVNLTTGPAESDDLQKVSAGIIAAQIKNGSTPPQAARTTIAGEPAVRLAFESTVATDDGDIRTSQIQHIFHHNKMTYILTAMNADEQLANTIATSLRLR